MIDFRYHIVSIIAIFLALACGIVLGTTALNGPILGDLRTQVQHISDDKRNLEVNVRAVQAQLDADRAFDTASAPLLVSNRLAGASVAIIMLPGADSGLADQLTTMVTQAAGTVTGRTTISPDFVNPANAADLARLVDGLVPSGVTLPGGGATTKAAAELASVLLDPAGAAAASGAVPLAADRAAVLNGLSQAGYVSAGAAPPPAQLALVVAGSAPAQPTASDQSTAGNLAAAAAQFAKFGHGAVVAGPAQSAQAGGVIAAIRAPGTGLAGRVSTVDVADQPWGQVATVFTLVGELHGSVGQFGQGPGAQSPLPLPSPAQ